MSKGGSQTVTQKLDPQTQAYVDQMRRAAVGYAGIGGAPTGNQGGTGGVVPAPYGGLGAAQAGGPNAFNAFLSRGAQGQPYPPFAPQYPPEIAAAQQQYGNYANAANLGLGALTGTGPNPFMNQYLGALNPTFDFLRQQAVNQADDRATQMGAFGGSRGDVFAGTAIGDINRAQAGLNYNAFNDAQQRALQLATLGYGAGAQSAFLPQAYASGQLGLLQQGIGPYGQTTSTKTSSDPFSQLLGLGLMFAPGGQLAGLLGGGASMALPMVV